MKCNTLISAVSNFSTAYNLVVINVVHVLVQNQYCGGDKCADAVSLASTACLAGAILGQLIFGYVGDCLGRGPALQLTMALSISGALASAFARPVTKNPSSIFIFLAITRFALGVGVGGVYPLSATIAAESSKAAQRGRTAALVFSMQGVANLAVPFVALALIQIFGAPQILSLGHSAGWAWRLTLGLGALPGILLAPFKVSEGRSSRSSRAPVSTSEIAAAENEDNRDTSCCQAPTRVSRNPTMSLLQAASTPEFRTKLIGTAGGWFLFDITFYGNVLYQPVVLHQVFHTRAHISVTGGLKDNICLQMALIALIGLPGYYVSVWLMDRLGRRNIQLQGFAMTGILFAVLGLFEERLRAAPSLMLALYGLTFFFANFGPNTTTFLLPAETFPPHVRTTLNGFSAAAGKVGATIGSSAFKSMVNTAGTAATMVACALISLAGVLVTYFFVEDRRGKAMEGEIEEGIAPVADALVDAADREDPVDGVERQSANPRSPLFANHVEESEPSQTSEP